MAPYLVENDCVGEVNIVFYVRGHTKNSCNRLSNQLKLWYHKQNVYTVEQVLDVLHIQPNITAIPTDAGMFLRYEEMIDKIYNKLDAGTIEKNYVFTVKKDGKKLVTEKRIPRDAEIVTQDLVMRGQLPERNEYISSSFFSICE
jgi:hypothetical protein